MCDFSKLDHPAHRCLRPTLHGTPRDVPCKTRGQDGVAGSFPAGDLHPLQHAGLSRRTAHHRRVTHRASCAEYSVPDGLPANRKLVAIWGWSRKTPELTDGATSGLSAV